MLRIKYERTNRGLSQSTVAISARVHQPTIALIEQGRLVPTPAQLARLAAFFGVPPERLLRDVEIVDEQRARRLC